MTDRDELADAVRSYLFWDRMCKNTAEAQEMAEGKGTALITAMLTKDYDTLDALIESLSSDEREFMLLYLVALVATLTQTRFS